MVKYQYLESERIDLKKVIGKMEAEIRRTKISFRGGVGSTAKNTNENENNLSNVE
jgi:hypothetical protein